MYNADYLFNDRGKLDNSFAQCKIHAKKQGRNINGSAWAWLIRFEWKKEGNYDP
jgi:hypothetical protein